MSLILMTNLTMILSGSGASIVAKLMSEHVEIPNSDGEKVWSDFNHPVVMCFLMFAGESILLLVNWTGYLNPLSKVDHSVEHRQIHPCYLAIPASIDIAGSVLAFIGLFTLAASTYQIVKTSQLISVAILSMALLRRRYDVGQWASILIVLFGLFIVARTGTYESAESSNAVIGITCMLLGQVCHASQMIFEEYLLKDMVGQEPLYVIGWEGTWGLLFTTIIFGASKHY